MPCFEDHCRESLSLFGKSYAEVHRWLDEFAGSEKYGFRHRKVRHHEAGIPEEAFKSLKNNPESFIGCHHPRQFESDEFE